MSLPLGHAALPGDADFFLPLEHGTSRRYAGAGAPSLLQVDSSNRRCRRRVCTRWVLAKTPSALALALTMGSNCKNVPLPL